MQPNSHHCLSARFVSPALGRMLALFPQHPDQGEGGVVEIGTDALEAALEEGDAAEAALDAEFNSLLSLPPSRASRLYRVRIAYLLYRAAHCRRRSDATKFRARAEMLLSERLAELAAVERAAELVANQPRVGGGRARRGRVPRDEGSVPSVPVAVEPKQTGVVSRSDPESTVESGRKASKKAKANATSTLTSSPKTTGTEAVTAAKARSGKKKSKAKRKHARQKKEKKKAAKRAAKAKPAIEPESVETSPTAKAPLPEPLDFSAPSSPLTDLPSDFEQVSDSDSDYDPRGHKRARQHPRPGLHSGPSTACAGAADATHQHAPEITPAANPNSIPLAISKKRKRRYGTARMVPLTQEVLARFGVHLVLPPDEGMREPWERYKANVGRWIPGEAALPVPQKTVPTGRRKESTTKRSGRRSIPDEDEQPEEDTDGLASAAQNNVPGPSTQSPQEVSSAIQAPSLRKTTNVPYALTTNILEDDSWAVQIPLGRTGSFAPPVPYTPPSRAKGIPVVARERLTVPPVLPGEPTRPAPPGQPPVWAETRQELCEALPYYRAYQSGMYMSNRVAHGYLLDGFAAPRDQWAADGRVIISHGGGQAVRATDAKGDPTVSLSADHSSADARIDTLLHAAKTRAPIVLLAGKGYALLPWDLPCQYVVLGWYWVSAAWFEAEPAAPGMSPPQGRDYFHRLKVRFNWVSAEGEPWWLRSGEGSWAPPRVDKASATVGTRPAGVPLSAPVCAETPVAPASVEALFTPINAKHITFDTTPKSQPLPLPTPTSLSRRMSDASPSSRLSSLHSVSEQTTSEDGLRTRSRTALPPSPPASPCPTREAQRRAWSKELSFSSFPTTYISRNEVIFPPERLHATEQGSQPHHLSLTEMLNPLTPRVSRPATPHLTPHRPEEAISTPPCPAQDAELARSPSETHSDKACTSCEMRSPQVYEHGWTCLVPSCTAFWKFHSGKRRAERPSPTQQLIYTPAFLKHIPCSERVPHDVVPPLVGGMAAADLAGTRNLWQGWVCNACGRANCRHRWEMLECLGCGAQLCALGEGDVVPASALLRTPGDLLGEDAEGSAQIPMSLRSLRIGTGTAMVVAYELPQAGTVYHVRHAGSAHADGIWEAYQRAAIHAPKDTPLFQRRALKMHTVKGAMLSQQFAINSGASYKYIVETLSYAFDDGPACVLDALDVIRTRVAAVLGTAVEFNEILSVMYREGQKMSWHDDGETGLGPVVAALSLGAGAVMSFRPKTKVRRAGPGRRHAAAVLDLQLAHGDVVIMAGRPIQFMYDHRVLPSGLRVAATARVIG